MSESDGRQNKGTLKRLGSSNADSCGLLNVISHIEYVISSWESDGSFAQEVVAVAWLRSLLHRTHHQEMDSIANFPSRHLKSSTRKFHMNWRISTALHARPRGVPLAGPARHLGPWCELLLPALHPDGAIDYMQRRRFREPLPTLPSCKNEQDGINPGQAEHALCFSHSE